MISQDEPINGMLPPTLSPSMPLAPPTIIEEVRTQQLWLRERLAGALTTPPSTIPASLLPTVPVIDLRPSFTPSHEARLAIATQIRSACLTTGFFQVSHHGIPESATDGVLEQARRFFHDLSPEQKDALHIKHSPLFRGYEPGDYTFVNSDDIIGTSNGSEVEINSKEETKQGFNFGYESSLDPTGGDGAYVELDGQPPQPGHTNVWPPENILPGFRTGIAAYYGPVLSLARHLFRLFALSLALPEDYFEPLCTHPGGIGRLLYYPAVSESDTSIVGPGKLGLGAHTDYECFTLLLADQHPGLEILFPPSPLTGNRPLWRPCPVRSGTITVNVGDFLMRWTNGLYKSTIHRVVSPPGTAARYSVPFFFSINYDAEVEPLPKRVVGVGKYRPMKAGVYVLERLKATKTLGEGVDDVGREAQE